MKRLIAFCSTLCLAVILLLTGCAGGDDLPNITGSLEVNIFKTDISVLARFVDSEDNALYNEKVKTYIVLNSTGEDAKKISEKSVSIEKPSEPTANLSGYKLDFTGLTADTTYSVKLMISSKGKQKTIASKEVTTLSTGETAEDPILIDSLDMLLGMNKTSTAYYKLTTDIDCGGTLTSIFNSSSKFSGTFDGNNHKIYNFKMDSNQYTGLFGYMSGATVKDLVLEDVSYNATRSNTYLGALVGCAYRCNISNVTVNNLTISHSGQTTTYGYIGGLVGQAENSTITDCTVNNLSLEIPYARLKMYVGGFVGENKNSKITNCMVTGSLTSTISYTSNKDGCLYIGGFSGINDSNLGIINCIAKTNITVKEPESVTATGKDTFKLYVGGFNGANTKDASRFDNCASVGDVAVTAVYAAYAYVGGFSGLVDDLNISTYIHCVYIPKEKGVTAKFASQPAEVTEENKVKQVAYISLAVGKLGSKPENRIHVIVYQDLLTIENEHENLTKTPYTISQDLSEFNETIRSLISEA